MVCMHESKHISFLCPCQCEIEMEMVLNRVEVYNKLFGTSSFGISAKRSDCSYVSNQLYSQFSKNIYNIAKKGKLGMFPSTCLEKSTN